MKPAADRPHASLARRDFLKAGAAGSAALLTRAWTAPAPRERRPRNVLLLISDQQGLDTLSAHGCEHVHTPHLDRLAARGTSFLESHTTNPVCSPARSSLFTGRMPSETGVVTNGLPIRKSIPNLGQWLGARGVDCVHVGKWHMPQSYTRFIPGFDVIPVGNNGHGTLLDRSVARACQGFLRNRRGDRPFCLVASFLQPHDICQWTSMHKAAPDTLPYPEIADELPPLPSNFRFDPHEPKPVANQRRGQHTDWSELQWRYYLWSYDRMVEEVDAEIGRVLESLDEAGLAEDTLVVFTSDHGEGRARHQMIVKNYLYEEALKVPLILAAPGCVPTGMQDRRHLVSGIDVTPTVCDLLGVEPPPHLTGRSLRPLFAGAAAAWRDHVLAEVKLSTAAPGYCLRTERYKYITYTGDPVEQLFDMQADPGETRNLATDTAGADALAEHRARLREHRAHLDLAPNAPVA